MFAARVVCDSVSEVRRRLVTWEATYPRSVLAEMNTHRVFSRNTASSRAIPTNVYLKAVMDDPYIPLWGRNKSGMQADDARPYSPEEDQQLTELWLQSRNLMVKQVEKYQDLNPHKQDV